MTIKKLLFIDTNIWLDFYRSRNEAGLALLHHAEVVARKIIVSFQVEAEFKKNRQTAILESMQELKAPAPIPRPGILSDARSAAMLNKTLREAEQRVKELKSRLARALDNPTIHDPVYQACQRIFHKSDSLVLTRDNKLRYLIRRKAMRRFLHGCPPRKKGDTSLGDAFNWEWMIHCARENAAELVIVSRDGDYGILFDGKAYINDHLKQEFSERVGKRRKLLLYTKLTDALKHFEVPITQREADAEIAFLWSKVSDALAHSPVIGPGQGTNTFTKLRHQLRRVRASYLDNVRKGLTELDPEVVADFDKDLAWIDERAGSEQGGDR